MSAQPAALAGARSGGDKAAPRPSVANRLQAERGHLIDGAFTGLGAARIPVVDPATGSKIAEIADGDARDVDRAVAAARASFEDGRWRSMGADQRSRAMWRFAELMEADSALMAEVEVLDNGMPLAFAQWELAASASWIRHYAGMTRPPSAANNSAAVSAPGARFHAYTAKQPIGVAALIVPWNAPVGNLSIKLAPALASGCSIVIKPAEDTSLNTLRLGELALEAGIPAGVVNIVTGYGQTVGRALVEHPGVDKISFTGSTETGKTIVRAAADRLKRVTLELGGKSPVLVFNDADLEQAIPQIAMAIFANTGQVCFAGSRLFVQSRVYDRVLEGVAEIARTMKVGSGLDPDVAIGPLISSKQKQRVEHYLDRGVAEGASLVAGGRGLDRPGFFVEPTIFAATRMDIDIVREEIFGPVLVATRVDDFDEMIKAANNTRYGLGAGVFTRDLKMAHEAARRIESGNVWVNCYGVTHPTMPFGGMKESGWGREMGEDGLNAYLETKSVFMNLA